MNMPYANKAIEIVLADDHSVVISGLAEWLNRCAGITVVGSAHDGQTLVEMIGQVEPDVVLTDIRMPVMNGIEAAGVIQQQYPATALIALSGDETPAMITNLVEANFNGIVLKTADESEVLEAIQHVYRGHPYYCRQTSNILHKMSEKGIFNVKNKTFKKILSEREERILQLMNMGLSAMQIGEKLGIKDRTVETYRDRMYLKTGTRGMVALIKWGMENGYGS